jgi:hypothetical protein
MTNALETVILYSVIFFGTLIMAVVAVRTARARTPALRAIPAYDALPGAAGEAVEADRPIHVSLGASAVREDSTLSALASAEILYFMAERAAIGDRPTLATVSDPLTLAVAQDALRQAYKARGMGSKFRPSLARWYPQGQLSLVFAAGVGAATRDEQILANILVGKLGPELALLAENAVRGDRQIIAQSDRIEGQAVAYVISDTPLIGEELYASTAYLSKRPIGVGGVVAMDILRYLTILAILLVAVYAFISGGN